MARMPGAHWLGEHSPCTLMTRHDIVCVHTIVGYAPAQAAHFSTHADGRIDQTRDTAYRSAANLEGNHRVIAIENEDHGAAYGNWSGNAVPPLTDAQVDAIAEILAWAHTEHGVPLQLCPDSRPGSRGLAYHRQGIDGHWSSFRFPGRVPGGETWTLSPGKVCPGDNRIAQLPEILRRAKVIVEGKKPAPKPTPKGDSRVGKFLKGGPSYDMGLLRSAAKHGRKDAAHALAIIDGVVARIPRDHRPTRVTAFLAAYRLGYLRLGTLTVASRKRPGVRGPLAQILAALEELRS